MSCETCDKCIEVCNSHVPNLRIVYAVFFCRKDFIRCRRIFLSKYRANKFAVSLLGAELTSRINSDRDSPKKTELLEKIRTLIASDMGNTKILAELNLIGDHYALNTDVEVRDLDTRE